MKLLENNGLRILSPNKGFYIANKDMSYVYEGELYLGKYDDLKNYTEVDITTRDKILKQIEEANKNK